MQALEEDGLTVQHVDYDAMHQEARLAWLENLTTTPSLMVGASGTVASLLAWLCVPTLSLDFGNDGRARSRASLGASAGTLTAPDHRESGGDRPAWPLRLTVEAVMDAALTLFSARYGRLPG
jgi:hypothetical protein